MKAPTSMDCDLYIRDIRSLLGENVSYMLHRFHFYKFFAPNCRMEIRYDSFEKLIVILFFYCTCDAPLWFPKIAPSLV